MKQRYRIYLYVTIAAISGLLAIPVAAFVNIIAGLVLLALPILLVYKAG
jgi:hypothetical protein